jgi:hypothetical protein
MQNRHQNYFLSVFEDERDVVYRRPFKDFSEAVAACSDYYEPRTTGAVLEFTVQVIGKVVRRAIAQLTRPEDVRPEHKNSPVSWRAAKDSNAFSFGHSYVFLIETDLGIEQTEQWKREDESEV